jgi:hypothetical protein
MAVTKLTTTDGFVVRDFADAPSSGLVRRARKILTSSAGDLARSATYTFASFEMQRGGASVGLNAEGDARGPAAEALVEELAGQAESGELHLYAGKGMHADELAGLQEAAGLSAVDGPAALCSGVVAAASWALGGSLAGRTVAIEGAGSGAPGGLGAAVAAAGGSVVEVDGVADKPWLIWGADVDVILAGSKPGALTHQGADHVRARALVPWGPIPFTTKALATLLRRDDCVVVPDFVSAAGELLAVHLDLPPDEVAARVAELVTACLGEAGADADGVFLGACRRAETYLSSWRSELPFGRPLAA